MHAVESFLYKLRERGCNFHVVWFDDHIQIASPTLRKEQSSKYSLLRTILIRHLQQAHVNDEASAYPEFCFEFPGLAHDAFKEYLAQTPIHFFLCLDPKAFAGCSENWVQSYLSIAHWLGVQRYSLVFINGVEFASSEVRSYVTGCPRCLSSHTDLTMVIGSRLRRLSILILARNGSCLAREAKCDRGRESQFQRRFFERCSNGELVSVERRQEAHLERSHCTLRTLHNGQVSQ